MKKSIDMCHGPIFKKIVIYTLPIIFTGVLQLLFNAADLIIVGRFRGSDSVAAVGATGAIINLIINLFIGLSVGISVSVAQGIGAGRDDDVSKTVHTAVPAAVVSGIFLTFVGIFGSEFFLSLMGTPDNILKLSATYMQIYFCGITASLIYNFGSAILRAAGDTISPLIFLVISGVINVFLNVFFVTVFSMNVEGVALATAISQAVSAVLVVIALMRRNDACRLSLKKLRFHKQQLKRIIRIGLPAGIQGSLFSISNVLIQSSVNSFGSVVMSGNAAAQNIEGFVYITMNSFHQTAVNFTGQNYGAGRIDRIKRILVISLCSVFTVGLILGTAAVVFSESLLSVYITDSAAAIGYGVTRLEFICLTYFLCGIMDVMTGMMRGIGSSFAPMIITILGVCGMRIGWIYTVFQMPRYHSIVSLYLSYPVSWAITFLVELTVFVVILKKRQKMLTNRELKP
ncbi:MAG: MATE family efflux transporter [Ruminococcus sp.]|nr:MATE family efflux transporter [Ruminococcus sp.]